MKRVLLMSSILTSQEWISFSDVYNTQKNCENASFENRACRFLLACRKTKRFLKLPQEKPNRITPLMLITVQSAIFSRLYPFVRSEERRVGKECRSRVSAYH